MRVLEVPQRDGEVLQLAVLLDVDIENQVHHTLERCWVLQRRPRSREIVFVKVVVVEEIVDSLVSLRAEEMKCCEPAKIRDNVLSGFISKPKTKKNAGTCGTYGLLFDIFLHVIIQCSHLHRPSDNGTRKTKRGEVWELFAQV
jgi:hypothetical protein